MKLDEATRIVSEMSNKGIVCEDDVTPYLNSNNLVKSKDDMAQIIQAAAMTNPFLLWSVKDRLADCASESSVYYDLIVYLTKNQYYDSLACLKELYKQDPDTALWLISQLEELDDESAGTPLGYLYGGMGMTEPAQLFDMAARKMTTVQKIAYPMAVSAASLKGGEKIAIPKQVTDFIMSLSGSDTVLVRRNAISHLFRLHLATPKVKKHLLSLAGKGDDHTKLALVSEVSISIEKWSGYLFSILQECSKTNDVNVQRNISELLSTFASVPALDCLKIVRRWAGQDFFLNEHDRFLANIGKNIHKNKNKIHMFMKSWICNERNRAIKVGALPYILAQVYWTNGDELVKLLMAVNYKDKKTSLLILATLQSFMDGYKASSGVDKLCNECEQILLNIAKHRGLDMAPDRELTNPKRVLDMLWRIKSRRKNPSIERAIKNLTHFPNLTTSIGKAKLETKIHNCPSHPLVDMLSDVFPPSSVVNKKIRKIEGEKYWWRKKVMLHSLEDAHYSLSVLSELDWSLSMFRHDYPHIGRVKSGLLRRAEFFNTLIELSIAARLKKTYHVVLQPSIDCGKLLDIKATIRCSEVLFEVYRRADDMKMQRISIQGSPNTIVSKIVEKIETQLKHAYSSQLPVVLVIDSSNAPEIDRSQIADCLFGTSHTALLNNGNTRNSSCCHPGLAEDSIYRKSKHADVISAIMLVRQRYDRADKTIKLEGDVFCAPYPKIQLEKKTAEAIKKAVFYTATSQVGAQPA